jgi:hypothetical protein
MVRQDTSTDQLADRRRSTDPDERWTISLSMR